MARHPYARIAIAALCLAAGCTSSRVIENTRVPEIAISETGSITFNDTPVKLGEITRAIKSAGIKQSQEVNILIPDRPDRSLMKAITAELVRGGYTRTIFVKNRKTSSAVTDLKK